MTFSSVPGVPRVVVVGGGIAGACVAFFASRLGWRVTVVDAGRGRASDVPAALLNPVRGQSGQVDARALAGLQASWALVRTLESLGQVVPCGQTGVLRPVPSDAARVKFERNLPPELPHRWLEAGEGPVLPDGWPHRLLVPEGGWVSGPGLLAALRGASGASVVRGVVSGWDARSVTLADGSVVRADRVVWCGGSLGALPQVGQGVGARHRRGSVLLLDRAVFPLPVSSGVYLSPAVGGGVLGATFETPTGAFGEGGPPLQSLHWLLSRAAALAPDLSAGVRGVWSGSRLSGEACGERPDGTWALTGLGSKGFLLGPLLAQALVDGLQASLGWPSGPGVGASSPGR
ncbi:NAD(P)/FAD-dependent oxidoreductase [Deinococcus aquiradiocola]|uniref:NAD(P)/FAD-dependent oxidoreductase n=1 Tax=Deinococcus aquiradiocola TaxID=393059 RepID=UPI001E328F54|nr:FAD-dependent oxidoreductase [Deinococcus aquiradiocola]